MKDFITFKWGEFLAWAETPTESTRGYDILSSFSFYVAICYIIIIIL